MSMPDDSYENEKNELESENIETIERSDEDERLAEPSLKDTYAFGLDIDPKTGLPRITGMGRGRIAGQMVQKATEAGTRVEKDPSMVRRMFKPTDDRVIPSRTYEVIAEILTFIYQLNEAFIRESVAKKLEEEAQQIQEERHPEEKEAEDTGEDYEESEYFEEEEFDEFENWH